MKVSVIFDPEPKEWAFRGDPYFWRHLKHRLSSVDLPKEPAWLERFIKEEHKKLTGEELTVNSMGIAKRFAHGGMTSGGLCGKFWIKYAIPLLKERLREACDDR